MAISWGGVAGHLQVGIDVRTDPVSAGTTAINIYIDYYVQSVAWGFNDNQALQPTVNGGGWGGAFGYRMVSGTGQTVALYVGTITVAGQGLSYGGGPSYVFGGQVSGNTQGGQPSHAVGFTLPARPASAPSAPGLSVGSVTDSGATISLSASSANGSSISGYQVLIGTSGGSAQAVIDSQVYNTTSTSLTRTVSSLDPYRRYYVIARARSNVGDSAWAGNPNFLTLSNSWLKVSGSWRRVVVRVKAGGTWRVVRVHKKASGSWRL